MAALSVMMTDQKNRKELARKFSEALFLKEMHVSNFRQRLYELGIVENPRDQPQNQIQGAQPRIGQAGISQAAASDEID